MPEPILIAPTGELDAPNVGDFRVALSEAALDAAQGVVVDLSDLNFIDSSGLGAIVELYRRLRRKKWRLAVVAPRGTAAAVLLNLAGLQNKLPIYEARQAALETQATLAPACGARSHRPRNCGALSKATVTCS